MSSLLPVPASPELSRENLALLKVSGNSMVKAGIKDGDYVVIRPTDILINGAIMAVKFQGQSLVKRIKIRKRGVRLIWEDGSGTSLITPLKNIEPQGEVVSVIKPQ